MLKATLLIVLNLLLINQINCARILGLFAFPTSSHFKLGNVLMKNLALRGHNITFISSFATKETIPNYNEIVLDDIITKTSGFQKELIGLRETSQIQQFIHTRENLILLTERIINHTKTQSLLKSNEKYDLVIMNYVLMDAHVGFAHHFNCPLILLSTVGSNILLNNYIYTPVPSSFVPQFFTGLTENMNFFERMENFLFGGFMSFTAYWYYLPKNNEILHRYFPDAPYITEVMQKRMSLILSISHPSYSVPKPLVPNMIEIGGFHIENVKPLPQDLKNYLDKATEGFILFSLGSNLNSKNLDEEKKMMFIRVFEKLPYKILWKFEDDKLENKPKNVRIEKWLPQNDILAHPNLKLFITQGGFLSTAEAVYHGVPLVGIPIFGDQRLNMAYTEKLGIGKTMDFTDLSYDNLLSAILEVINNKKYREKCRERSNILHDQPLRPIDNAVFWVEYALRHKYADHLKTGAQLLHWYQIDCLDIIAALVGVTLLTVFTIYKIFKKLFFSSIQKTTDKKKIQ